MDQNANVDEGDSSITDIPPMKAKLASSLMRILAITWRITVIGAMPKAPSIVVFWHGVMLPVWKLFAMKQAPARQAPDRPALDHTAPDRPAALVSASKDGSLLTQLLEDWGYHVVRGSSSSGGAEALDAMVKLAAESIVLVTPDGPRGPAHVCKPGAVVAAFRAAAPIYVVRIHIHSARIFDRSWDSFQLPLPFSRITVHIDEAIRESVDGKGLATREEIEKMIENVQVRLNVDDSMEGVMG